MDTLERLARPEAAKQQPDVAEQLPLDDSFDDFLDLFDELRGLVPLSFFILFKIARVLKTPDGKLGGELKGFFDICRDADRTALLDENSNFSLSEQVPVFNGHDPYMGTRRIKSVEEISSVLPNDVAIEEFTDLIRKAEERQLDVRVLLHENETNASKETAPITDRGSRQMSNAAEQKLYILLDRSYSMWEHHRLLFAKVLAIEFLRRKKGTGARLFYRPFDFDVYALEKVVKRTDYDALIRKLLFIEPGGKGTDIQTALLTAVEDIKFDGMFEGAEILLITDGCDRVEVDVLREAFADKVKLHMIKIGRDAQEPGSAEIKDMIEKDQSIAGMDRDRIAALYKKQLLTQWDELTETMIETDDLDGADMNVGAEEIQFALESADKVLQTDIAGLTSTEVESTFRRASFIEGFLTFLAERGETSPAVAAQAGEIKAKREALAQFKLRLVAKNQTLANLLANKDLKFVTDRKLRREAKKANLTLEDLASLNDSDDLYLKLKLTGQNKPGEGEGLSLLKLLGLMAKSAVRAATGWLTGGEEKEKEEPEPSPNKQDQ
ncbi:MAG TPA: VWA domain-containing protein [bacterium]|nr:VWA domain-containing protein [bacterium]